MSHLEVLRSGRAIERPTYDFSSHTRSATTVRVEPEQVVIVEGILVLADSALRDVMDLKIYVDTDADLRVVRRLGRDILERGRSVDSVLDQYLATVRPMHLQFVESSKRYADLIVPEGYNAGHRRHRHVPDSRFPRQSLTDRGAESRASATGIAAAANMAWPAPEAWN